MNNLLQPVILLNNKLKYILKDDGIWLDWDGIYYWLIFCLLIVFILVFIILILINRIM